jgi:hypothetical protein
MAGVPRWKRQDYGFAGGKAFQRLRLTGDVF